MRFTDLIMNEIAETKEADRQLDEAIQKSIDEKKEQTADELLRDADIKIKLVTKTSFGQQIDLAKQYDEEKIKEILKDFTIKFKGKSIFVVE